MGKFKIRTMHCEPTGEKDVCGDDIFSSMREIKEFEAFFDTREAAFSHAVLMAEAEVDHLNFEYDCCEDIFFEIAQDAVYESMLAVQVIYFNGYTEDTDIVTKHYIEEV